MMEMFYIQYSDHQPPVAIKHLKCGQCSRGTGFLILFDFNELK